MTSRLAKGPNLLINGNFSTAAPASAPPNTISGWSTYTWEGTFAAARTTAASFDDTANKQYYSKPATHDGTSEPLRRRSSQQQQQQQLQPLPRVPEAGKSVPAASAMIQGWAPGKYGLLQKVALHEPGTYELGSVVAAQGVELGLYGQTFTFLIIVDTPARIIGDISLLPSSSAANVRTGSNHTRASHIDGRSSSSSSDGVADEDSGEGWRSFQGSFEIVEPTNITVYFRAWGAGFFFVTDVWLAERARGDAPPPPPPKTPQESFTLGAVVKPLNFTRPVTFEDLLLCGYCPSAAGDAAARTTTVCKRCSTANKTALIPPAQANASRILDNYTAGHKPLFYPSNCWNASAGGQSPPRLALSPNCFIETNPAVLPADWSAYGSLAFNVTNPSAEPQNVYVEIDDCQSTDYWSRLDFYTFAAPGTSTVVVPVDRAVGEKSEIGQYRRPLKLACITRIALLWDADASSSSSTLEFGPLSLQPVAPYVHDFPELLKIDVQPRSAPVQRGFTGLYGNAYSNLSGYGLVEGTQVYEMQDRGHPTSLWRDWISFESGGIAIDLPDGEYTVMLCMVDAGYWEYYQNYNMRQVSLEGKVVLNETMTLEDFYAQYYQHQRTEDLPGDSSWDRYIAPRYTWQKYPSIAVVDGSLDIEFGCPTTFGCTLSGLIVYPTAKEAGAAAFVSELAVAMELRYNQGYMQYVPPQLPHRSVPTTVSAAADANRGARDEHDSGDKDTAATVAAAATLVTNATVDAGNLVVFQRPIDEDVNAYDSPLPSDTIVADGGVLAPVRTFAAAAGDATSTSVSFAFTLKVPYEGWTGGNVASITVSGLGAGLAVSAYGVRYKQKRLTADGSVYMMAPLLLDPITPPAVGNSTGAAASWIDGVVPAGAMLKPGLARRVWCRLHTIPRTLHPRSSSPGGMRTSTTATVTVAFTAASHPSLLLRLPIIVMASAALPAPTQWLGYLGMSPLYPATVWDAVAEKQQSEMLPSAQLLRRAGMTAVTGGIAGPVFNGYAANGSAVVNTSAFDAAMEVAASIFPAVPVNTYGGLNVEGTTDPADMTAVAKVLATHIKAKGWPTVFESVGDEPAAGAAVDAADALAVAIAKAAPASSGVFESAVFTSFLTADDPRAELANHTSLVVLGEHNLTSIQHVRSKGKQWMLYNSGSRFKRGFYMCMLAPLGCLGHYEFMYSSVHADPYYALDSREDDLCAARTTSVPGMLVAHVDLYRLGGGTRDLQLCLALQRAVKNASPSPQRATGAALLADIMAIQVGAADSATLAWNASKVASMSDAVFDAVDALSTLG